MCHAIIQKMFCTHDDRGRHECVNVIMFCCISLIHLNLLLLSDEFELWLEPHSKTVTMYIA